MPSSNASTATSKASDQGTQPSGSGKKWPNSRLGKNGKTGESNQDSGGGALLGPKSYISDSDSKNLSNSQQPTTSSTSDLPAVNIITPTPLSTGHMNPASQDFIPRFQGMGMSDSHGQVPRGNISNVR